MAQTLPERAPLVSVVMSNFNGASYLEAALASVLGQSHRALELIVVDDASQDDSLAILHRVAAGDSRLRIISQPHNTGPAGARNAALKSARGEWIAIVDADDLMHPHRIKRLLAVAQTKGVDAIADDLVSFGSAQTAGKTLLEDRQLTAPLTLTAAELIQSDTVTSGLGSFGYLKPMIHRNALGTLRYDETLRVGEDFDLYARLLIYGVSFLVVPAPLYLYRRHSGSISHRLSVPVLQKLLDANGTLAHRATQHRPQDSDLQAAFIGRAAVLERALRYQRLVDALKARKGVEGLRRLIRDPVLLLDLGASLADRLRRRTPETGVPAKPWTLVMADPERVGQLSAPLDAIRIPVSANDAEPDADWAAQRSLASRLVKLTGDALPDVIAEGPAGLEGLGYLPAWRSARLMLDARTAQHAIVPPGVAVEVLAGQS
ncbi:glycosyltransferase family 2 protein [Roseobacter weihaiensis]|uniref:glycosyltransferase family 2 protein n=1 Tax=Roseobacter weihaiensis TaxID=2763262 RepID=UPI001D0A170E|nr:glycosyltransferase family 2 protein [Roseobacter sp. H9]